jgi:hypothetical protein
MFAVDGTRSPDEVHQDIVGRLAKMAAFAPSADQDVATA